MVSTSVPGDLMFGMEIKDLVSNAIAFLALVVAVISVYSSRSARKRAKEAEEQQQKLAQEWQRRQASLAEAQHGTTTRVVELMIELKRRDDSVNSDDHPAAQLPEVEWIAEHPSKNTWLLRNVGVGEATNVTVDKAAIGGVRVDITPNSPAAIQPGGSVTIVAIGAWGTPVADEALVTWGNSQQALVALPRWQ